MKKAALTFEEQLACAYLHYAYGVEQNALSVAYRVNIGRVNEACKAIKAACEKLPKRDEGVTWSQADKNNDVVLTNGGRVSVETLMDFGS
jgi:hypothetical protein